MEYPISLKEKGIGYWASLRTRTDNLAPSDGSPRNLIPEDPFNNFSELMNFDTYAGWCNSPSAIDHMFGSYGFPSFQSAPNACFEALNFADQNSTTFADGGDTLNAVTPFDNCGDKTVFQHTNSQLRCPSDSTDVDGLAAKQSDGAYQRDIVNLMISRPIGLSLDERMLRALSLLKVSFEGGILAQVWVPIRCGDQYMLSTSEQPYLLDQMLAGYREVSRKFTFSAEVKSGYPLGLPGRVFISKVPEWTSNIIYYSRAEYLRVKHAVDHAVRGSFALPVLDTHGMSCCAVLELVTVKEKSDFDSEIENVCHALQVLFLHI